MSSAGTAASARAAAKAPAVQRECVAVVKACRAGGFVPGKKNKHRGQGLWTDCVRVLAAGRPVAGVKGVSKQAAQACLKARYRPHAAKS